MVREERGEKERGVSDGEGGERGGEREGGSMMVSTPKHVELLTWSRIARAMTGREV